MRRTDLAHLLRAASTIASDPNILVIGSQAILGSYSEEELPREAWLSVEADLAFIDDPASRKADQVDGAIGELSLFHKTHSYYAQGVDVSTAVLPGRWWERVVSFDADAAAPATAVCLDRHDLVVSKLVAHREKDLAFARALLRALLVDVDTLVERAHQLPDEHALVRAAVLRWLARARKELGT